ncbi:PIR protein [Plasmodium ovale]|uniref:PIR Superfamily Protein n=2 Tax=Plasmodium ovale TaxID=36330 RepID=A0A1A8WS68_PLAOA|nr:PIR Superfamily Protein [Plasmodium ovale curtisi]SBT83790.1 PIR protein [Plasmodium ovale]
MPSQRNPTDFSSLFQRSPKEFFSEKFYDAMNSDSLDLDDYTQKCNKIMVSKEKDNMITVCKNFLRFLEKSIAWNGVNSGYDISLLLNYWLYNELMGIYGPDRFSEISIAFGALQYIWEYHVYYPKNEVYHKKCKPELSKVYHQDWDKRKKLYDYYVDYDTLFTMAKSYDDDKCEYYKKIEENKSLYEYFEEECKPEKHNFPEFYDECKKYNPNLVLSKLPCHSKIISQRTVPAAAKPGTTHHHEVHVQDSAARGLPTGSEIEVIPEISNIGTRVGHSVLGVAPFLLSATALYRYTPVGSWIRKLCGYNSNSLRNMQEGEMNEFLDNTENSGDMFLNNTENYISYQPM